MTTFDFADIRDAAAKRAVLEEIRKELATMTEQERTWLLLQLREIHEREQKERLGRRK